MPNQQTRRERFLRWTRTSFNWRPTVLTFVVTFLILFAVQVSQAFDWMLMVFMFVVGPLVVLTLIVAAIRNKSLTAWSLPFIFCLTSWVCINNRYVIRDYGRWVLLGRGYRATVLRQKKIAGELQHAEWDGWGFAGSDTEAYLVHDPTNSLAAVANRKDPIRSKALPCDVWRVSKLQSTWYAVTFYTNQVWDGC